MSLQTTCTELIHLMMGYLDIPELNITSTLCKNMKNDAHTYATIMKQSDLKTLTDEHTCRNCQKKSYDVDKQFCTDCFLFKCDNCYCVRNSMSEFVKYRTMNDQGVYEIKLMCYDYCMYRCHKCKFVDTPHELFFNNQNELQVICVDCFVGLSEIEKLNYNKVQNNDEWDDLDALD
jgi:hypothetical protein